MYCIYTYRYTYKGIFIIQTLEKKLLKLNIYHISNNLKLQNNFINSRNNLNS